MKESRPLWRPDTRQVATRPLTGSNCLYCTVYNRLTYERVEATVEAGYAASGDPSSNWL